MESWRSDRRKTAERGYGAAWQRARLRFLALNPLCEMCLASKPSRVTAAAVVDHRVPHRGDMALFWNPSNWAALCKLHHDSTKQRLEKSGRVAGCDESGQPIDRNHHWRK